MTYDEFKSLMLEWYRETAMLSVGQTKHRNAKKILEAENKGDIIGYACLCLEDMHFIRIIVYILDTLVLHAEHPPIPEYFRGRVPVVWECYKYWALKQGYVFSKYDPHSYWVEDQYGNKGAWH